MGVLDGLKGRGKAIKKSPKAALALSAMIMFMRGTRDEESMTKEALRLIGGNIDDFSIALDVYKENIDYETGGIDKIVEAVSESLNKKQQESTLANLIDIAMEDGILDGAEEEALEIFIDKFDVDKEKLDNFIHISNLKNDITIFE